MLSKGKENNFKEKESGLQRKTKVFLESKTLGGEKRARLKERVSKERAYGGCLGADRRRRTQQAAKSLGELQAS